MPSTHAPVLALPAAEHAAVLLLSAEHTASGSQRVALPLPAALNPRSHSQRKPAPATCGTQRARAAGQGSLPLRSLHQSHLGAVRLQRRPPKPSAQAQA